MLDTHPYRIWIAEYSAVHDLAYEKGADPAAHGSLGEPYKRWLTRVQTHMNALNVQAVKAGKPQPYKGVKANGKLDPATRAALTPDRPTWQSELVRIVHQDAAKPNAAYYTQGPERWQGVRAVYGHIEAHPDEFPEITSGDCSAGATRWHLAAWQSHLGRVPHDFVNGFRWQAGYTGSIYDTCARVRGGIQIGDLPLYGTGDFHHVMCVIDPERKLCGNHGGQSGPNVVEWAYNETPAVFVRPNYATA